MLCISNWLSSLIYRKIVHVLGITKALQMYFDSENIKQVNCTLLKSRVIQTNNSSGYRFTKALTQNVKLRNNFLT